MPADTLANMALRRLATRGRDIHDFGAIPVHLIESILPKCNNPDQLRLLEQRSPQIIGYTREVWLSMLKRDIPFWEKRLPEDWEHTIFSYDNKHKWHKVYYKLKKDVEAEKEKSRAALVQVLQKTAAERGPVTAVRTREPIYLGDKKRVRKSYEDAKFTLNHNMYSKSKSEGFFDKVKRNAATKAASKRLAPGRPMKPAVQREIRRAPLSMVEDIKDSREAVINNVGLPPQENRTGQKRPRQENVPQKPDSLHIAKLTADFLEDDSDNDNHNGSMGVSDHDTDDELFGITRPTKRARHSPPPPRKLMSQPSRPTRTESPLPSTIKASNAVNSLSSHKSTEATTRNTGATTKPTMIKRTKPARSIFAKR